LPRGANAMTTQQQQPLCISEGQDTFILGALQAFFGCDFMFLDEFFTNLGSKVVAWD